DGDGLIDEDFDTNGDGIARCCGKDPFFTTLNLARTELFAHHRACTDTGFTPSLTSIAVAPAGQLIQVNGIAEFNASGTLAVFWTENVSRVRNLTFCNGSEWETLPFGAWNYNYFGGAEIDGDGLPDFIGWDQKNSFVSGPILGPGPDLGVTTLSNSWSFPETPSTYDTNPLLGEWVAARAYNLQDLDSDGRHDLMYHGYATGGPSDTDVYFLPGNGGGTFGPPVAIGTITSQPQNSGDLGYIDDCRPDGACADWIGGPDDDGNKGAVYAFFGDCTGGFSGPVLVADACPGACPGSGSAHGSGMSQLYDWDCDGSLELLTSHVVHTNATATVTYWENDCGNFNTPIQVINNQPIRQNIATPLRN
ncbi:MAG: hypothetical protein KDD47_21705, partial [Acidobacteria bacterium]|nr:hypothetical protein [Acidobacteriota bacterium]